MAAVSAGPHGAAFVSSQPGRPPHFISWPGAALPNGGFADLPSPAAGFIRAWDFVQVVPTTAAAPLSAIVASILPGPLLASSVAVSGANGSTASVFVYTPIGAAETLRISNGGPNAGRVVGNYTDLPASMITLIRQPVTAAPAVIIPAPAAGRARRLLVTPGRSSQLVVGLVRALITNPDTAVVQCVFSLGGLLYARQPNTAVAASSVPLQPVSAVCVTAATGDLAIATEVAPTTNPALFLSAWEEIAA